MWALVGCALGLLTLLALGLRTYGAGVPFHTGDFACLPYKVSRWYGFTWIITHIHGPVLPTIDLLFAKAVVALGGVMNEAMWRLPLGLIGTAQVPLTFVLMRRLRGNVWASLMAAAIVAVMPSLTSDARYPYGYEVLGVFMASLALWAWLRALDRSTRASRWLAGGLLGLYLLSHLVIYAVPIVVTTAVLISLGLRKGLRRLLTLSTLVPVILAASCILFAFFGLGGGILGRMARHVGHGTLNVGASTPIDLLALWHGHMGPIWSAFCIVAVLVGLVLLVRRDRRGLPAWWVVVYVTPMVILLDFGNIGRPTSYQIQGTFAASLAGCLLLQVLAESAVSLSRRTRAAVRVTLAGFGAAVVALLLLGSVSSLFTPDRWPALTGTVDYGRVVPDPGFKAAGWYVREHVPDDALILATHGIMGLEYPCVFYYLGRHVAAAEDTSFETECRIIEAVRADIDIALVEPRYLTRFAPRFGFTLPVRFMRDGRPVLYVAARSGYEIPTMDVDIPQANRLYDRDYRLKEVPELVTELPRTAAVNHEILVLLAEADERLENEKGQATLSGRTSWAEP